MRPPRFALLCLVIGGARALATPQPAPTTPIPAPTPPTASTSRPAPPTAPCALAAFNELATVQARVKAFAATGVITLADKLELAIDVPTGYTMISPGQDRLRDLFAATDPKRIAAILADIDHDLDDILRDGHPWTYRCEAYPTSHLAAKPLAAKELTARRVIAKRTLAAHARAAECARLQGRVLAAPESKRFAFTSALDRCHADLEAAHAQCDKDFSTIEHTDAFAPYRASIAVSNLIELRHVHTITAADVTAVRARIEPMLDALQPPLSSFTAGTRAALALKDPTAALYDLSGQLKVLYSPCEQLWTSESRCIVRPESCRKRPN